MIHLRGHLPRYLFDNLASAGVSHGVYTRHGGYSRGRYASLNVGRSVGDAAVDVRANEAKIFDSLGLAPSQVVSGEQVHGDHVSWVSAADGCRIMAATDGLLTSVPGVALFLRYADCVPVLMAVPGRGAVGLVHAGWKGTLAGIVAKAAKMLADGAGCPTSAIIAGIGPSIGRCCYQVGPEIAEAFVATFAYAGDLLSQGDADGRAHLDLWEANARQLASVGVNQIERASLCTRCHRDVFYSHRGDGVPTGRFAAVIQAPGGGHD